jgi:hypothetical protein
VTLRLRQGAAVLLLGAIAALTGFSGASTQSAGLVLGGMFAVAGLYWLYVTGRPVRLWAIGVGALLFLNNGAGASLSQVAYGLALTMEAIVARLCDNSRLVNSHVRSLLGITVALLSCSALVGINAGYGMLPVVSGLLPYAILIGSIVTALHMAPTVKTEHVTEVVWVVGILSIALSTISWVQRRGFSDTSVVVPGGASKFLILPLVVLSLMYLREGRKLIGTVPISLYLTSSLLIGSRLAVVGGLLGCFTIWAAEGRWRTLLRTSSIAVSAASGGVYLFIQSLTPGPSRDNFTERLSYMATSVRSFSKLSTDDSANLREAATHAAWNVVHLHPWFGAGPGVIVSHYGMSGGRLIWVSGTALDTPIMTLAKIGILATMALALLAVVVLVRPRCTRTGVRPGLYFLVLAAVQIPLGSPLEDAGFGIGVMLAVLLAGVPRGPLGDDHGDAIASTGRSEMSFTPVGSSARTLR